MAPHAGRLVLASTSPYRRDLLERLGLPFDTLRPEVDETAAVGEAPAALAVRLAVAKAEAGARARPGGVVIGSDQVADLGGLPLGKSGDRERAITQLLAMSGRTVDFHTAVCVLRDGGAPRTAQDVTRVCFRTLDRDEVERYVDAERPFDCAGSFKCEGLGIALFERIRSEDPTALVGLPLIATAALLREAGFRVP